jgi:hypothetical protein
MKERSKARVFWNRVSEDDSLIFFLIGFFTWLLTFIADLRKLETPSSLWIASHIAIPCLLIAGIVLYLRKHYRLTGQLVSVKHLPIVFVIGKPWDEAKASLTSAQEIVARLTGFKAFRQTEKSFNVRYEHLIPYQQDHLRPEASQWRNLIENAERNIHRFSDVIPGEKIYHIFIYGPASLALGLGAAFGSKRKVVVYQYLNGDYKPVINLMQDVRRIKQVTDNTEYKYIRVSYPRFFTPDLAVVLDMASHSARGDAEAYLQQNNQQMELVHVANTYGGNLTEDDWVKVVQEIYSVFHYLQSKKEVARLHVFHSMPVALAFGVGMALGNFVPVTIYNWEASEGKYYPVLKLNEVESFL